MTKLYAMKTTASISHSIFASLVSTGVRLFEANAIGLPLPWESFGIKTVPRLTFDASNWRVTV